MRDPLRARLALFAFLYEVGPLITLHTLWFADHGISAAEVSSVFVLWALVGVVLEVPSGALADRMDRRRVVGAAVVLRGLGVAVWMLWPTLAGMVVGAVLWAINGALASGAWEALVHDELSAIGEADDYGRTNARLSQAWSLGIFVGTAAAYGLLQAGVPLSWLGWLTVALHLPAWLAVRSLPPVPMAHDEDDDDEGALSLAAWWRTLRTGVEQVRQRPVVGRLVAVGAVLGGLFLVDEYVPLLGRVRGATDAQVAGLVLVVWLGGLLGSELAARGHRQPSWRPAAALFVGTLVAMVGLGAGPWWALPLLAVGYATQFVAHLYADARLQDHLSDPAGQRTRATVTSVRELLSNGVSTLILAIVGASSVGVDPTPGLWVMLVAIAGAALLAAAWVPDPQRSAES